MGNSHSSKSHDTSRSSAAFSTPPNSPVHNYPQQVPISSTQKHQTQPPLRPQPVVQAWLHPNPLILQALSMSPLSLNLFQFRDFPPALAHPKSKHLTHVLLSMPTWVTALFVGCTSTSTLGSHQGMLEPRLGTTGEKGPEEADSSVRGTRRSFHAILWRPYRSRRYRQRACPSVCSQSASAAPIPRASRERFCIRNL